MTPKEKAIQLVNKYLKFTSKHDSLETAGLGALTLAKACALVVVDEILESSPRCPSNVDWDDCGATHQYYYETQIEDAAKFWQEVKIEIEKL